MKSDDIPSLPSKRIKLDTFTLFKFYQIERQLYLKSKTNNIIEYKQHYKHLKNTFETVSNFVRTHVLQYNTNPNFQPIHQINPQYLETFMIKDIYSH